MIAKYCANLKGAGVGYNYILTVAKNWAFDNVKTAGAVEERLMTLAFDNSAVRAVLKALKLKRTADHDDYEYVEKWRRLGFAAPVIESIAKTRRGAELEELDGVLTGLHAANIVSADAVDGYLSGEKSRDKTIRKLLEALGIPREVTQIDRDFYRTWTDVWKFGTEMVDYVAAQSVGKGAPLQYMNKVLSTYFDKKISTVAAAKQTPVTPATPNMIRHSYSDDELKSHVTKQGELKYESKRN
jgi:hypothetical protein